jgi:AcrR family transcriptional regulator
VEQDEVRRRASYGPRSPVVGERGGRTRQHILDVTLELIARRGLHDTSVDDIATAANTSRATLYQYFESKDQIFSELLDECGSALMRVVKRLGPLGPTAQGFDNLHWWLGEWAWVYDRYSAMFAQWAQLEAAQTPLRRTVTGFVDAYVDRISRRLAASGFEAPSGTDLAAAVMLVVHRFNAFRRAGRTRGISAREMLDSLAVVIQLVLFPDTPADVLGSLGALAVSDDRGASANAVPACEVADRFAGRSARVRQTVRRLLDAAATMFAGRGFPATSVDDIATEAGVARGTLYKYFTDKIDLLGALAEEAHAELREVLRRLPAAGPDIRHWLDEYLPAYRRHAGVLQVWVEGHADDEVVRRHADGLAREVRLAVAAFLAQVDRHHPVDLRVAALVMIAALERLPVGLTVRSREVATDEVVETIAAFVERGLLNAGTRARSRTGVGGLTPTA